MSITVIIRDVNNALTWLWLLSTLSPRLSTHPVLSSHRHAPTRLLQHMLASVLICSLHLSVVALISNILNWPECTANDCLLDPFGSLHLVCCSSTCVWSPLDVCAPRTGTAINAALGHPPTAFTHGAPQAFTLALSKRLTRYVHRQLLFNHGEQKKVSIAEALAMRALLGSWDK